MITVILIIYRGDTYIKISFLIMLFIIYYYGNEIKKDEMGRACSTHGFDKKCIKIVVWWLSINISEHRAAYIFINPED
jgi:hypothetical protein